MLQVIQLCSPTRIEQYSQISSFSLSNIYSLDCSAVSSSSRSDGLISHNSDGTTHLSPSFASSSAHLSWMPFQTLCNNILFFHILYQCRSHSKQLHYMKLQNQVPLRAHSLTAFASSPSGNPIPYFHIKSRSHYKTAQKQMISYKKATFISKTFNLQASATLPTRPLPMSSIQYSHHHQMRSQEHYEEPHFFKLTLCHTPSVSEFVMFEQVELAHFQHRVQCTKSLSHNIPRSSSTMSLDAKASCSTTPFSTSFCDTIRPSSIEGFLLLLEMTFLQLSKDLNITKQSWEHTYTINTFWMLASPAATDHAYHSIITIWAA